MDDTLLKYDSVELSFGGNSVVHDISFSLRPGEILGLVGESGSGKSTVAKLITRLEAVTEGQIILDGQDITHLKGRALKSIYDKIQMVFQNPVGSFDPRKTLGHGIGESLKNRGIPKEEIRKKTANLLEQCGLEASYMDRYPHQVSGGQCQRAAIARALAVEPQIIICDEATSALDVTVQKKVIDLLMNLQENKKLSYIFICHNLALVQQFCDRVIVMKDGRIVEEGIPDEVIRNPKDAYTKMLVDSVLQMGKKGNLIFIPRVGLWPLWGVVILLSIRKRS